MAAVDMGFEFSVHWGLLPSMGTADYAKPRRADNFSFFNWSLSIFSTTLGNHSAMASAAALFSWRSSQRLRARFHGELAGAGVVVAVLPFAAAAQLFGAGGEAGFEFLDATQVGRHRGQCGLACGLGFDPGLFRCGRSAFCCLAAWTALAAARASCWLLQAQLRVMRFAQRAAACGEFLMQSVGQVAVRVVAGV